MRGRQDNQAFMLSTLTPNDLVRPDHTIRKIKPIVDRILTQLSPTFTAMYTEKGRPSIPPEHLLKGCLLIALFSIRSERQFCEQLEYTMLFKWFLDLNIGDPAFDPSTFSKNRERLLEHEVAAKCFQAVVAEAKERRLLRADHFTVDGTLLEAWASLKSFRPKDGSGGPTPPGRNPAVDFHREERLNATHASTTDPEALLARKGKGKEAKLSFLAGILMENKEGILMDITVARATGTAERETALGHVEKRPGTRRLTVGADKAYDSQAFVEGCRARNVTPQVAQRQHSSIDRRTTRHPGYAVGQRVRKRVEEIFGWIKTVGGGRKLRYRGVRKNQLWAEMTGAAYNLVRLAKLLPDAPLPG